MGVTVLPFRIVEKRKGDAVGPACHRAPAVRQKLGECQPVSFWELGPASSAGAHSTSPAWPLLCPWNGHLWLWWCSALNWSSFPTAGDSISSYVKEDEDGVNLSHHSCKAQSRDEMAESLVNWEEGPGIEHHDYLYLARPYSSIKPPDYFLSLFLSQAQGATYTWTLN